MMSAAPERAPSLQPLNIDRDQDAFLERAELQDLRFRSLTGERAWRQLPAPVQRRFSKRLAPGESAFYRGRVVATELSRAGRVLSFLARAIGSPLPLTNGAIGPAFVIVTEDAKLGGQSWTRSYARPGRFPQVIHSAKRFRGATGLEEYVGRGAGMELQVSVEDGALVFRSRRYFIAWGSLQIALPAALSPGRMEIVHRQETNREFSFRLTLTHKRLGRLLHQFAYFTDV